ncbi:hypothetical protein INR49_007747, partial [Caranx melampygus]
GNEGRAEGRSLGTALVGVDKATDWRSGAGIGLIRNKGQKLYVEPQQCIFFADCSHRAAAAAARLRSASRGSAAFGAENKAVASLSFASSRPVFPRTLPGR